MQHAACAVSSRQFKVWFNLQVFINFFLIVNEGHGIPQNLITSTRAATSARKVQVPDLVHAAAPFTCTNASTPKTAETCPAPAPVLLVHLFQSAPVAAMPTATPLPRQPGPR